MFVLKKKSLLIHLAVITLGYLPISHAAPNSASLAYGTGEPNQFNGLRIALQWDSDRVWFQSSAWQLTGYWDVSVAYWQTHDNNDNDNPQLFGVAAAPVLRLQKTVPIAEVIRPYLDAGIGLAYLSDDNFGRRDLGSNVHFEDRIGIGASMGRSQQWDLAYYFLHYSNASFFPPNQGIDVKSLIMVTYRWL